VTVRVELSGELTLQTSEVARTQLAGAFGERRGVIIDCAAVEACDLSGAQVIVSALRTAVRDGQAARVVPSTSGVLADVLSRAGLMETFEALSAACAQAAGPEASA
jgi:anti-anti-sigma regulatory factor